MNYKWIIKSEAYIFFEERFDKGCIFHLSSLSNDVFSPLFLLDRSFGFFYTLVGLKNMIKGKFKG
jgi:hypothetical protein